MNNNWSVVANNKLKRRTRKKLRNANDNKFIINYTYLSNQDVIDRTIKLLSDYTGYDFSFNETENGIFYNCTTNPNIHISIHKPNDPSKSNAGFAHIKYNKTGNLLEQYQPFIRFYTTVTNGNLHWKTSNIINGNSTREITNKNIIKLANITASVLTEIKIPIKNNKKHGGGKFNTNTKIIINIDKLNNKPIEIEYIKNNDIDIKRCYLKDSKLPLN
jgi:hypothetical protein